MSCRYEPHAQLSSTPLQATPFQICFPIRADNSNHFLYRLPSNTTAEDGHSFSKPEATDVRLIIQKLFYLTELKKAFKMLPYMNKLESLWSFCSFMHRKLPQVRDISCFCFYFHLLTFYKSEIHSLRLFTNRSLNLVRFFLLAFTQTCWKQSSTAQNKTVRVSF